MHVLFSVPRYHPNHDGMVEGLLGAGHRVTFVVRSVGRNERHREGVTLVRLGEAPANSEGHASIRFRDLFAYLRRTRPDVVIARNASAVSTRLYPMCRVLGIGFLLYVQARDGLETMDWRRKALLWLGLWPRHTINSACPHAVSDVPGKTFDFLPFAVSTEGPARMSGPGGTPLKVLAVGKLDQQRKNLAPLVRHVAPMLRAGQVTLTIAGTRRRDDDNPVYRELLAEITNQEVGHAVDLRENLSFEASRRFYSAHDLFVLASSEEPAAISPAEALAAGLPVICGSDNGTNYFVRQGETGFVFADCDFDAMAGFVRHFVDAPSECERMGSNGRRMIKDEYSPDTWVRRFEDVVRRRLEVTG